MEPCTIWVGGREQGEGGALSQASHAGVTCCLRADLCAPELTPPATEGGVKVRKMGEQSMQPGDQNPHPLSRAGWLVSPSMSERGLFPTM